MAKKVLGFIGFGLSIIVVFFYLIVVCFMNVSDATAMLILLLFLIPFVVLGLLGCIFIRKKIMAGIFMIFGGLVAPFIGFMCAGAGGSISLIMFVLGFPLGIISAILYFVSAGLTIASK